MDALETAVGFGLSLAVRPASEPVPAVTADPARALQSSAGFDLLLAHWLPLPFALNSLNRGMGLPGLYLFILAPNRRGEAPLRPRGYCRLKGCSTMKSPTTARL
ncbi:MAG: putative zinc-binding metallopeptidase [Verrucomicrobiae bacterium]|nr:putative zinc-binding metallopeptidase [Verrucomicrobiae bacterium]